MAIEEIRFLHEDLERIEQAVSERYMRDPKSNRERLRRDHDVASLTNHFIAQSNRLRAIEANRDALHGEIQQMSTGETDTKFYREIERLGQHYARYPNAPVENLEKAYKRRSAEEEIGALREIDSMFSGEESCGRYFDMIALHHQWLNLPTNGKRITYLQYLDIFDIFKYPQFPIRRQDRMNDEYARYLDALAGYLESFMRRVRPLEDFDQLFASFDEAFKTAWEKDEVAEWADEGQPAAVPDDEGFSCHVCAKVFANENVYTHHLESKKHLKNVQAQGKAVAKTDVRPKERAIAAREDRIKRLAAAMQGERSDTKVNVERKAGMTEREREQEIEQMMEEIENTVVLEEGEEGEEQQGEEKIYNPLKLPLAWDGKPIPYWLYKLHGLGNELSCEICGNYVYMGRRAFDKHFTEPRHIYGLHCLGINNTMLFKEVTSIEDAKALWKHVVAKKKEERAEEDNVIQMEDSHGNVMPEKVYQDLARQGLL